MGDCCRSRTAYFASINYVLMNSCIYDSKNCRQIEAYSVLYNLDPLRVANRVTSK